MRPYTEYIELREKYECDADKRDYETIEEFNKLDPSDYIIFGHLMKDITESVKSAAGREAILYKLGDDEKGYSVRTKMDVYNLITVAICLSATLDKNVSKDKLYGIFSKYHDPHAYDAYNQYKNVIESERYVEKTKQQ